MDDNRPLEPTPTFDELVQLPASELARMIIERDVALLRADRDLVALAVRMMLRVEWAISEAFGRPEA